MDYWFISILNISVGVKLDFTNWKEKRFQWATKGQPLAPEPTEELTA